MYSCCPRCDPQSIGKASNNLGRVQSTHSTTQKLCFPWLMGADASPEAGECRPGLGLSLYHGGPFSKSCTKRASSENHRVPRAPAEKSVAFSPFESRMACRGRAPCWYGELLLAPGSGCAGNRTMTASKVLYESSLAVVSRPYTTHCQILEYLSRRRCYH